MENTKYHEKLGVNREGWVTLDWKDGWEKLRGKGVRLDQWCGSERWYLEIQNRCILRNFPCLVVEEAHLSDCVFENCRNIELEDGTAVRCVFAEVDSVSLMDMKVYDSVFRDLSLDNECWLIEMVDSILSGCEFRDITLEDEASLAYGSGQCLIEKCHFENVTAEGDLFGAEEESGKVIRRKR